MTKFNGSHVLITGAAKGIGRLIALGAFQRGARLSLLDLDETAMEGLRNEISAAGGDVATFGVDVSDRASLQATTKRILETRGVVDILINNAGIVSGKPLLQISDEAIERTLKVNTLALFWTVRAFLPAMIAQGSGHIVTVASAGGLVGTSRLTDYCASKFAAVGFDESLRLELQRLGHPIRTTVVCPYYIDTGMFKGVKTRFSWILPILKPDYVAKRILGAIEGNRCRLIMPRFLTATPLTRILPSSLFDALMGCLGINRTMDEFTGH